MAAEDEFDYSRIKNVIVEYTIPYSLDLPNSLNLEDGNKGYFPVIDNIPAVIRTERVPNTTPSIQGFEFSPFCRGRNDRHGLISKTKVQIWFDKQMFNSGKVDIKTIRIITRHLFGQSIIYLNKLIRDYQRVTGEYWTFQIRPQDIIGYNYCVKMWEGEPEMCWVPIHDRVEFFDKNPVISKEQEDQLKILLEKDSTDLLDDLRLSVYDNYDRGHYNTALIQCAILFEHFVYSNLKKNLSKTKLDKIKKKEPCQCMVGIYKVCEQGLKDTYGLDFGSTKEFSELAGKVIKIRNNIVHGERLESINQEECEMAIKATSDAIDFLNKELFSKPQANGSG